MTQQFTITPIALDDGRLADGVLVNAEGAWLGEVQESARGYDRVMPFSDEGGDYIEAPEGWYEAPGTQGIDVEVSR